MMVASPALSPAELRAAVVEQVLVARVKESSVKPLSPSAAALSLLSQSPIVTLMPIVLLSAVIALLVYAPAESVSRFLLLDMFVEKLLDLAMSRKFALLAKSSALLMSRSLLRLFADLPS